VARPDLAAAIAYQRWGKFVGASAPMIEAETIESEPELVESDK
jgi:hypothetical protein